MFSTSRPAPSPTERNRVILAGIAALILTVGLARFAYTPMLPIMRREIGLTPLAGGWLATLNYAGYISGALLAALTSDLQRKFIYYRVGLVLAVLTTAAMGLTSNLWLWLLLRYLSGLSSCAGLLIASGLVLNWLMRNRLRPELGLHFSGIGLGIVISGLAVAGLQTGLHWDGQWLGLGGLGLLFFIPAWIWMPKPQAPGAAQSAATAMRPAPRGWMALFVASYFCAGFGYVISATFIVAIVETVPLLSHAGSWVWVLVGAAALPSTFVWDRIASAAGANQALLLAYALQIVSCALPVVSQQPWAGLVSAMLWGATFVGIVSLTLSIIGRRFPANPAKAMARLTLSYGVAQIIAPVLAGAIATRSGSYLGALVLACWVMLAGMLLLGLLLAREKAAG